MGHTFMIPLQGPCSAELVNLIDGSQVISVGSEDVFCGFSSVVFSADSQSAEFTAYKHQLWQQLIHRERTCGTLAAVSP